MDHVMDDLRRWLERYEADPPEQQDKQAIACIQKALQELGKYYQ